MLTVRQLDNTPNLMDTCSGRPRVIQFTGEDVYSVDYIVTVRSREGHITPMQSYIDLSLNVTTE